MPIAANIVGEFGCDLGPAFAAEPQDGFGVGVVVHGADEEQGLAFGRDGGRVLAGEGGGINSIWYHVNSCFRGAAEEFVSFDITDHEVG